MEQKPTMPGLFSYDEVDAFVAAIFQWLEQRSNRTEKRDVEPPFSDEWERKQMARELQWD